MSDTYLVNRVWTDDGSCDYGNPGFTASLTGTVDIPRGNYILDAKTPLPFTAVKLVLTVTIGTESTAMALNEAYDYISGSAKVIIHADKNALTIQHTGNATVTNAAVLQFWDDTGLVCYALGQDSVRASQGAFVRGIFTIARVGDAPQVFGVVH